MSPQDEGVAIVAKGKPGRPKKARGSETRQYGALVRVAEDVAADAKTIANIDGISAAELVTETLRPIFKERLDEWAKRRLEGR